jgi:hypothetical protein
MEKTFDHSPHKMRLAGGKCLMMESDQGRIVIIWIRKKSDMASLVHECVHAANFTLDAINADPTFENDEPQAYLVEAIFRKARGK